MVGSNGRRRSRMALLGWLAVIGIGLIGCNQRGLDPDSAVVPTTQFESETLTSTSHDAILWHAGDINSAFAVAPSARKPVLLYWGADWCPPCSRLKATVFRRPEFVKRTRLFVAVNLNGDDPGAQRLGEEFDVAGYPTVIVLSPDREEITRIAIGLEMEQYVNALDTARARAGRHPTGVRCLLGRTQRRCHGVGPASARFLLLDPGQRTAAPQVAVGDCVEDPRDVVSCSPCRREVAHFPGLPHRLWDIGFGRGRDAAAARRGAKRGTCTPA